MEWLGCSKSKATNVMNVLKGSKSHRKGYRLRCRKGAVF